MVHQHTTVQGVIASTANQEISTQAAKQAVVAYGAKEIVQTIDDGVVTPLTQDDAEVVVGIGVVAKETVAHRERNGHRTSRHHHARDARSNFKVLRDVSHIATALHLSGGACIDLGRNWSALRV